MGKKSKLWIKMLAATTLLSAGLVWPGNTAYAAEGDVEINEENFPSSEFREYILQYIDKDKNGILNNNELDEATEIDFDKKKENGEVYRVDSVEGIDYFKNLKKVNRGTESNLIGFIPGNFRNLEYLDCNGLYLENNALSNNPNLKYLDCSHCSLMSLDLSKNQNLEYLDCSHNILNELISPNAENLKYIDCSYNEIRKLDITQNPNLEYLDCCCNTFISEIITDANPELRTFKCAVLSLVRLDVTKNLELEYLDCQDNVLYGIDLSKNSKLKYLDCSYNRMDIIDISECDENIALCCDGGVKVITRKKKEGAGGDAVINETNFPDKKFREYVKSFDVLDNNDCLSASELAIATKIDVSQIESAKGLEFFYNLETLICKSDELKEIDISKNTKLKKIQLNCNKVKNIDFSHNTELVEANLMGTKLASIDLSQNQKLKRVSFWTYSGIVDLSNHPTLESVHQEGLTTYLNLEGDTSLTKIEFQDSDLAKINIKGCTSLKNLNFAGSALTELDLSGCEKIESLQLSMPKLQKLYAGPDSQLKEFTISDSEQLSCIDLSGSAKLESFSCAGCPLVEKLTISNEAPLREFICNNTILKELDLSPYSKLGTLNIYTNNALAKLSLPQQSQLGTADIQGNGKLAVIQFPQSGKIENLVCKNNAVENADLSGCNEVKKVDFNGNASLKSISLPVQIKSLILGNNKSVSNIQFPQGCKVSTISCNDSGMENIDLSECHELEKAEFMNNVALKSIVFPNSDYLETIKCNQNNLLQSIDVSKCKYLLELYCGGNALQSLNLLDNINLRKLDCNNNQLKELVMPRDLSYDILTSGGDTEKVGNSLVVNSLKDLNCSSNQLKNLELSDCEALTHLDCTKNQIKRIDISSCDELLKRVTGAKEEASGQVKYVDGIDGGYCLTCDSDVKVILYGTVDEIFDDVIKSEWYMQAIQFVYNNKVMRGVSDTSFAPKITLTREQFITVLYNLEGSPEITFKKCFDDVTDETSWYAKSVTWAAENGITSGVGGNKFGVGVEITREQLATLLYNYAEKKDEYKLSVDENAVANFPDAGIIDSWASDGMKWAITNGVMSGKKGKDGQIFLDPLGKATRAECAQMIKNLKENAVK